MSAAPSAGLTQTLPHIAYRAAVDAKDHNAVALTFSPTIRFHSPTKLKPFEGSGMARWLMGNILEVIEDFSFTQVWGDKASAALFFKGTIGGLDCEGVDHLTFDESGNITDFRVMIRPLKAVNALNDIMGPRLAAAMEDPEAFL